MEEKYVKCISLFNKYPNVLCDGVIGKIYRIRHEHSNLDWFLEGITYSVSKTRFEPATKEEWDLQEGFYVKDILVEDLSYQEDLIRLLKNVK
jgi:hypothetical protein